MIKLRPANERGATQIEWLDSRHTFSFNQYYDPNHMGFRSLRVINDDRVAPGAGFPTHGHRDMEILTWVLEGAIAHRDSMGTGSVLRPSEIQRMSAGTGITHSEYNHSKTEPLHFLQIWIHPQRRGQQPSYEQRAFPVEERSGKLRLVASGQPREGAAAIDQDVDLYVTFLQPGQTARHPIKSGRYAWVQVGSGSVTLNGAALEAGDGAAVSQEQEIEITANKPAEVLLFDLA